MPVWPDRRDPTKLPCAAPAARAAPERAPRVAPASGVPSAAACSALRYYSWGVRAQSYGARGVQPLHERSHAARALMALRQRAPSLGASPASRHPAWVAPGATPAQAQTRTDLRDPLWLPTLAPTKKKRDEGLQARLSAPRIEWLAVALERVVSLALQVGGREICARLPTSPSRAHHPPPHRRPSQDA